MAKSVYKGAAYITRQYDGFTQYSFDGGKTWRISIENAYKAGTSKGANQ